jgi:tetratricopeptide (TPR) repeat protein
MWQTLAGDFLLVGCKEDTPVNYRALQQRMQEERVAADLARINVRTLPDLLGSLVMGRKGAERFAQGAVLHTDDNSLLEFSAPRDMPRENCPRLFAEIDPYWEADLAFLTSSPQDAAGLAEIQKQTALFVEARHHVARSIVALRQSRPSAGVAELVLATQKNPRDALLLESAGELVNPLSALPQDQVGPAVQMYETLVAIHPENEIILRNLASALEQQGHLDTAAGRYLQVLEKKPDDAFASFRLARIYYREGKRDEAADYYRRCLKSQPDAVPALTTLAWILSTHPDAARRNPPEAIRLARKACELTENKDGIALDTLSAAYEAAGQVSDAVAAAELALKTAIAAGDKQLAREVRAHLDSLKARR